MNERVYYLDRVRQASRGEARRAVEALAAIWLAAVAPIGPADEERRR